MTKTDLHALRTAIGAISMAVEALPPSEWRDMVERNAEKALEILDAQDFKNCSQSPSPTSPSPRP